MCKAWLIAAALCLQGGAVFAAEAASSCKTSPNLVGACFSVHGRVFVSDGPRRFHIAIIESGRILDVLGHETWAGDKSALPADLGALLAPLGSAVEVEGDYIVCPFDRTNTVRAQAVCIEAASHLTARRH